MANEVSITLQKELDETNLKLSKAEEAAKLPATKKKAPMLGAIGKLSSSDGVSVNSTCSKTEHKFINLQKVSRESLTRGGSQDDPAQLLRDLQDSLEREADLREQLKFAEEEVSPFLPIFYTSLMNNGTFYNASWEEGLQQDVLS